MAQSIDAFIAKWGQNSGAAERANKDAFLYELCDVLDVPRPDPTTGFPERDRYVFEKDALTPHEGGVVTVGKIDLYKAGAFILEAKQGSEKGSKKLGTAKRYTPAWNVAMQDAYGQAAGYARTFADPVPFLIACDIGCCFDLYASFDGTRNYRQFPNPQASRIFLADLARHRETLRQIFLDPLSLDPARKSAKVTREVATHLAALARALEKEGHRQELVATFLMRCLFTMFAEDVGLLPKELFTGAIREFWIPNPASFPAGIEILWRTMNDGGAMFGAASKILRFNGGLFANPSALPLDRHALDLLLVAATANWADVEPAIFGTLLERALDPKERHRLGAHYTPRAYVERLVRPTIEEPLRADWEIVQAEVRQLVVEASTSAAMGDLTEADIRSIGRVGAKAAKKTRIGQEGARTKKLNEAKALLHGFHKKLASLRVLDPACGSGNFLYVTLDLFKRLEAEVLAALAALGDTQELLRADAIRVTPGQFHGIEVKRWAKEIAELVLWIGYLQWHFRAHGKNFPVPEPVLIDYRNIQCRDALLEYDSEELVRDEKGKPVSKWDGETIKISPVTGKKVPDESARVPIYSYVNARKAVWPSADFVVGNPPFVGNKRMRRVLGDGYVETLRRVYDDVPETADYVMYWWNEAAKLVRAGSVRRSGLITTNSIVQTYGRSVVGRHVDGAENPASLVFAVPDHPWVDGSTAAAVRIAMTVLASGTLLGAVLKVVREAPDEDATQIEFTTEVGRIQADLTVGAPSAKSQSLRANERLGFRGITLVGDGFILGEGDLPDSAVVRTLVGAKALLGTGTARRVVDLFGKSESEARDEHPAEYQRLDNLVRPGRAQQKRMTYANNWWIFAEPRAGFRAAASGLPRYIATVETSRHRWFSFVESSSLPEQTLVAIALADAAHFAVLSSRVHIAWAAAAKARMGVGNDLRYTIALCFDPFPFPTADDRQLAAMRAAGERLDAHRKRQKAAHPKLKVTDVYNVLEKVRSGQMLSAKERLVHEDGLVSVLGKVHDEVDATVLDAYGWPHDLTDGLILERLVALNAERVQEERKGIVRWLRPDFQAPTAGAPHTRQGGPTAEESEAHDAVDETTVAAAPWPKKLPWQISAIRNLVRAPGSSWSAASVARSFTGAKKKEVETVLQSLAALGLLLAYQAKGERRWKTPDA